MLEAIQRAFAESVVTQHASPLSHWANLDPPWRLVVYQNNYRQSLIGTLEQIFIRTRTLLGNSLFGQFSEYYVAHNPSNEPNLNAYGASLPSSLGHYLRTQRNVADMPYLQDVAQIDLMLHQAYYAANAPWYKGPSFLSMTEAEQIKQCFRRLPSINLLQSNWPLDTIVVGGPAVGKQDLPANDNRPGKKPHYFMVYRDRGKPRLIRVIKSQYRLLSILAETHSLEALNRDCPELTTNLLELYTQSWIYQVG